MKDEEVPLWATTRDVAAASARRVERTTGDIWGSGVGGGRKERMGRRKERRDKVGVRSRTSSKGRGVTYIPAPFALRK